MAYRPRTPEDVNRLAAAAAELPLVANGEGQTPLGPMPGQRLMTEADAGINGITLDDIRRMMSNPGRYGQLYTDQQPRQQEARGQPKKTAVENDKRTKTRTNAAGEKKTASRDAPLPPRRPETTGAADSGIPWGPLLTGLGIGGAGALARMAMMRKQVPGEEQLALPGPAKRLPPPAGGDAIEDAIWREVPTPSVSGPPAMPAVAGGVPPEMARIAGSVAPPPAPMADPRAAINLGDQSAPTDETFRRQQQALEAAIMAEPPPLPPPSEIVARNPKLRNSSIQGGRGRTPRKPRAPKVR